jgi:hypothetical protein
MRVVFASTMPPAKESDIPPEQNARFRNNLILRDIKAGLLKAKHYNSGMFYFCASRYSSPTKTVMQYSLQESLVVPDEK